MPKKNNATILKPEELNELREPLPKSWIGAAGILKGRKRIDPVKYQRSIRKGWEKRMSRQLKTVS